MLQWTAMKWVSWCNTDVRMQMTVCLLRSTSL